MLTPRWRKVLRDLWGNRARTLLVILSITIGVFAVGMIISTHAMLTRDLARSYAATNPPHAVLYPSPFEADLVETVRKVDGVQDAEARRTARLRYLAAPDEWKVINVDVAADYEALRLSKISAVSGAWPPPEREVLIERASLPLLGLSAGDTLLLETADGRQRALPIAGAYHDLHKLPAQFSGEPYAVVTMDTLSWLGFSPTFDQLFLTVSANDTDVDHVRAVAAEVAAKLEKDNHVVYWTWIPEPGVHPANDYIQPMLIILGVLGTISLFAGGFLVVNIINSLLAQQVKHIGIMKTIGARTVQIVQMYLAMVLIFGALALLLAVPLGAAGAYLLTGYVANLINFDLTRFYLPGQTLAVQIGLALIVPVLAALFPILRGARITVREAISEYGLGKGQFGAHALDRFVEWLTGRLLPLSRPVRISLRNSVRRKARLALTLATLALGGAIFMAVLSVHASFQATLDDALKYFNYDVELTFVYPQRIAEVQRELADTPGVAVVENWTSMSGRRVRADGVDGPNFALMGIPAQTDLLQPTLLAGRWLTPADENALVVNTQLLREEADVQVGDVLLLNVNGRQTEWRVVGVVQGVMTGPIAYANQPYLARSLRQVGRSDTVQIAGAAHDPASQQALARRLSDQFNGRGLRVSGVQTIGDIRQAITFQFNLVAGFLLITAVLIAAVGGLGLTGTMSMNVLERTREIGVMRAVGASSGAIVQIVLVEGIFIGFVSWLFSALFAFPLGRLMSDAVGNAFLQSPLTYRFASHSALLWLVGILLIAALASWLPAWNAARLSVRETLAYE